MGNILRNAKKYEKKDAQMTDSKNDKGERHDSGTKPKKDKKRKGEKKDKDTSKKSKSKWCM